MLKSIFSKQLAAYLLSILAAFVILAFGLNYMLQNFFVNQAADTLVRQGQRIAASYEHLEGITGQMGRGMGAGMGLGMQRNQALARFESDMHTLETLGASAFLVSYFEGYLEGIIATGDILQIQLDEEMLRVFDGDTIILPIPAGELFDMAMLTVGYPIIVEGELWGAIFMSSSMDDIAAATASAMRLVFLAMGSALVVSFILVFITSRNMSRRITSVGRAAKEIAGGGFGRRIDIRAIKKDEIGQLAQSFNHMAQSLDDIEKTRREFISNISHDLRSPLTSMQGFLVAMLDGTINEQDREKYLEIVLGQTRRLTTLANDILTLTNIQDSDGGSELSTQNFDINELLRQTIILFESQIASNELSVNIDFAEERALVNADKEKMSRVVHNLVENAVKFTNSGEIRLSTHVKSDKIHIEIADTGIGMDDATKAYAFDRFYKADASRGSGSGSGLGLAIVKEMLAVHGEDISLDSELDKGSVFSFTIPMA
ncbi:MAG: HAMP domain-containing histidine kinase [Defluviitaleaceae bacterium]|nr:HAMP domain-containing histidine kinase [Defluviitaleaceae bacterium]